MSIYEGMAMRVERLPQQSLAWRVFAVSVALLLLVMIQRRPIIPGAGLDWAGVKALYWSVAIIGLVGYAYGFRVLSQIFWRVYSLVFTADITIRAMTKVGRVLFARLFGLPENSRHDTTTILLGLGLIATVCVALLRYGGWMGRSNEPPSNFRQEMFVEPSKVVEPPPPVELPPALEEHGLPYTWARCAVAALAAAALSALAMRAVLGEWPLGLATFEFLLALLGLLCGGRSLANRLAATGNDTVIRGAVIGAAIGAFAGTGIALFFAGTLLGFRILLNPTLVVIGLYGLPLGAAHGAITGVILVLIGRSSTGAAH